MKKLENKVALVTGGSRGIGAAIVYALAEEGANLGVNYIVNKEKTEQVCENVRKKNGVKVIALKADVSVPDEVQKMVDTMLKEFGKIDVLVNNAGIAVQSRDKPMGVRYVFTTLRTVKCHKFQVDFAGRGLTIRN